MLTRLWIALGLFIVAGFAFFLFSLYQRRQATSAFRAGGDPAGDETGQPRVLYFRSESCTSCETQSRLLAKLDDTTRALIRPVDVDRERELAAAYNILTLPTILVVDGEGEVRHINYGVIPPTRLEAQLADL
jgi:thiol-disulfide isomerase/thioredoxin